jgi:hypothetical protein
MTSNYSNGKIYKIVDNVSDMIYVGSTCKTLEQRLSEHEFRYKYILSGKKASKLTSFKILENNNYKIELIENFPCQSKQELEKKEGHFIKLYRKQELNIVNKCVAGQDQYELLTCKCGYKYIHKHQAKHNRSYLHQKALGLIKNVISNNNNCVININITVNNLDELEQLEQDFLNAMK